MVVRAGFHSYSSIYTMETFDIKGIEVAKESGSMFGTIVIKVDNQNSTNVASWALFDSVEHHDEEAWEQHFPASGFTVVSLETPQNLTISDFGNFEWSLDDLMFECQATWEIAADPSDFEAWGSAFQNMWGDALVRLKHSHHQGVQFLGYFSEAPEYN